MFSLCFISQYFSFNVFEFNLLVILVREDICIWYFVDVCFCVSPPPQYFSFNVYQSLAYFGMCWNMYLIFYWPLPEDPYFSFNVFQSLGSFWYVLKCVFDILLMSASGILHFVIVPYVDINYHTSQIGITEN